MPTRTPIAARRARRLRCRKHKHTERASGLSGRAAACNACPVKAQCTTSDHGAAASPRSLDEAYLERVRGYHATEAYQKAMRKRQVWVEPLFAEAKEWHGLRRLRLRGLLNANIQGLLIAAGQNLKRFLAATGWGRRHAPCGSLVALPSRASATLARLRLMTDPVGDQGTDELDLEWPVTATSATGGFFQRPGSLSRARNQ